MSQVSEMMNQTTNKSILDELLRQSGDEEDDKKNYGMPLFLGGLGQPMSPAGYAALMGGVQTDPSYLGAARPISVSPQSYQSLDSLLPNAQQASPKSTMNITYNAPDGNQYNISARFDPADRTKVVDGLMKSAYELVMSAGEGKSDYGVKSQPKISYGGNSKGAKGSKVYGVKGHYAPSGKSSYAGKAYAGKAGSKGGSSGGGK